MSKWTVRILPWKLIQKSTCHFETELTQHVSHYNCTVVVLFTCSCSKPDFLQGSDEGIKDLNSRLNHYKMMRCKTKSHTNLLPTLRKYKMSWFFTFMHFLKALIDSIFCRRVSPALPQRIVCVRIWFAMRRRSPATSVASSCLLLTSQITWGCTTSRSTTPVICVTAVSTDHRRYFYINMTLSSALVFWAVTSLPQLSPAAADSFSQWKSSENLTACSLLSTK